MTSISSNYTATSSYVQSLDTNGDGVVSAEELAAGDKKSGRTQDPTVEVGGSAAAQSQLSGMLFQSMNAASDSGTMNPPSFADMFAAMDDDGDGSVSEAEFVAARPEDVTEEMATALFGRIDSEGSGSISEDQYVSMMEAQPPMGPPPPPQNEDTERLSFADLFAEMDSDGDGTISAAEFVAARPDDVTEDMATQLFSDIDTEQTGSITEEQFTTAMTAMRTPPEASAEDVDTVSLADILERVNALFSEYLADAADGTSTESILV